MDDIKFVINLDYPNNSEDYVHRIGRTGRSNNTGTAYTFFTPSNANKANDLISVLQEAKQVVNPKLIQLAESSRSFSGLELLLFLMLCCTLFDKLKVVSKLLFHDAFVSVVLKSMQV